MKCYFGCEGDMKQKNRSTQICSVCKSECYMDYGGWKRISFRYNHGKGEWGLHFYPDTNDFYLDRYDSKTENVLHLKFLPSITPFNVAEKLPTLLNFS